MLSEQIHLMMTISFQLWSNLQQS